MERDMDVVRRVLLEIEKQYIPGTKTIRNFKIEDLSREEIYEYLILLENENLIQKLDRLPNGNGCDYVYPGNLTYYGYDFLDKIRDDRTWQKTVKMIAEKGLDMSIKTIGTIATAFITAATEGVVSAIIKNGGQS